MKTRKLTSASARSVTKGATALLTVFHTAICPPAQAAAFLSGADRQVKHNIEANTEPCGSSACCLRGVCCSGVSVGPSAAHSPHNCHISVGFSFSTHIFITLHPRLYPVGVKGKACSHCTARETRPPHFLLIHPLYTTHVLCIRTGYVRQSPCVVFCLQIFCKHPFYIATVNDIFSGQGKEIDAATHIAASRSSTACQPVSSSSCLNRPPVKHTVFKPLVSRDG